MGRFKGHAVALALLIGTAAAKKNSAGGSKACSHTGFYSKKIVPLCEKHFPDDASKNLWIVQFYHPYVQENVLTKGIFEELASTPEKLGGAKVGAVDCQQNNEFCVKHGIRKAPTTKVFLRTNVREFTGEHTMEALQKLALESTKLFEDAEAALKCKVK